MIIIPAIDLLDREAVRLFKGDYSQKTVYSTSPWELVSAFEKNGAELIHLVDLNGARNEQDINKDCIEKIRSSSRLKIQIGGGIRNLSKLKSYRDMGMDRFILGTAAVLEPKFVDDALALVGSERLLVSVDAFQGIVRISGWEASAEIKYEALLERLEKQGITQIVFTDISTDGTLSGPNIQSYKKILDSFHFQLIASGGISSMKDILDLSSIQSQKSLYGIITGKAIYEGKLSLKEAIARANLSKENGV